MAQSKKGNYHLCECKATTLSADPPAINIDLSTETDNAVRYLNNTDFLGQFFRNLRNSKSRSRSRIRRSRSQSPCIRRSRSRSQSPDFFPDK